MGLECFRSKEKKDDGYTNIDVINSNLRTFRWWFEKDKSQMEGLFNGICDDNSNSDITNRRIAVIDE